MIQYVTAHPLVPGLFFAVVILTACGTGLPLIAGVTGIVLCILGLSQKEIRADLWILIPLLGYSVFSLISSWQMVGDPFEGYVYMQLICPVFFFLTAALEEGERILLKRSCLLWSGVTATAGIAGFTANAFGGETKRLGGIFGNANVLGIFLVFSWFALRERRDEKSPGILAYVEPLLLYALGLTLSMGSFAAMAAGILVLILVESRSGQGKDVLGLLPEILARASAGIGAGILLYLAAGSGNPWLCIPVLAGMAALAALWKKFEKNVAEKRKTAAVFSGLGVVVAVSAVALRPSSIATFAERLEMMENGLGYIRENPVFGVGPGQWHLWNAFDAGKYFNTWYIHDVFLHIGAELGICAMILLLAAAVRSLGKKRPGALQAGLVALMIHYCLDVGFAYMGVAAAAMILLGMPEKKGRLVKPAAVKVFFLVFAILFACGLVSDRPFDGTKEEQEAVIQGNSPLTEYVDLTSNATFPREQKIRKITIHHMAADLTLEEAGELFAREDREASANYAIDSEGRVGLYVEEKNRAWTSADRDNDGQAVTIEVANDEIGGQWHVSDQAYETLIDLCVDICRRNGIPELVYTGTEEGTLTIHKMFDEETQCPGPYLESRMPEIAEEVNQRL